MEYDTILKHLLLNDSRINKLQSKFSLDYLKCKIENCYSDENKKEKKLIINHEEYENCKKKCISSLESFLSFKQEIYKEYSSFYYEKFYECSKFLDEDEYTHCIAERKRMMKGSIENIKEVFENYD